nr:hypothetical protein [Methylomarinum sp. Ch1-1]MDP4522715.1 hypothetical protein [Methylomarinum sp. Ch1-1]
MHGFPLNISKKLMVELLTRLRPSDRFNILFFPAVPRCWPKARCPPPKAT